MSLSALQGLAEDVPAFELERSLGAAVLPRSFCGEHKTGVQPTASSVEVGVECRDALLIRIQKGCSGVA